MSNLCFALDLSSPKGSFCLFENSSAKTSLIEKELPGAFTHSETLLSELHASLNQIGIALTDIDTWITASGPGSFTGLRIAYATLKAFALASCKPIVTVEGPEARAYAFLTARGHLETSQHLDVLSYLTADKFVVSSFECMELNLKKVSETIQQSPSFARSGNGLILTEDRIRASTEISESNGSIVFPLSASHLKFFSGLLSKKEFSASEFSELTPLYYGSSHFD